MVAVNGGYYMYMVQTIGNQCLLTFSLNSRSLHLMGYALYFSKAVIS